MPFKRLSILLAVFAVVFVLNLMMLTSLNQSIEVRESQERILAEIEQIEVPNEPRSDHAPLVLGTIESDVKLIDGRAAKLRRYLRSLNSPLFDYADLLVEEADKYDYDYRLLVAIALQESTGCKFIPHNSYNCWGWGIYGDKVTRFSSYEEGIRTVSKGIKENYLDRGLVTTEQIMARYTPSSNGSWARAVRFFFNRIENY